MREDLEQLKQRIPLLDYWQRRNWTARRVGARAEFVGLCPLHPESRPSFYVNTHLRVPRYEFGRLMPPSWFLRFWTGQAGLG